MRGINGNNLYRTSFGQTWKNMIDRCKKPDLPIYKYYGGRGIRVCKRWLKYENFEKDMYDEYGLYIEQKLSVRKFPVKKYFTLDRINNNQHYCKKNCRWVSMKVQCNNRNNNLTMKNKAAQALAKKSVAKRKKTLGKNYKKEMSRMAQLRWKKEPNLTNIQSPTAV